MDRQISWLVDIQRRIVRTTWGILSSIVIGLITAVVSLAAAAHTFLAAVLWRAAARLTNVALVRIQLAFLNHPSWPWLGVFPYRAPWQRTAVAAFLWLAGAVLLLGVWFSTSAILVGRVPLAPIPSRVVMFLALSGFLGVAAASSSSERAGT